MSNLFGKESHSSSHEGTLTRLIFHNSENGWTVALLQDAEGGGEITLVGTLLGLAEGDTLRVHGLWVEDARFGQQFRVERFEKTRPKTLEGIERYLASGLVKGVGPVLAKRLVEEFQHDTLNVLDEEPHKLHRVSGLGKTRVKALTKAWRQQHAAHEVMVFLQSHGVSASLAARIYSEYGQQSMDTVTADPYRLARDVTGIGFRTADAIAQALGLPANAPQRLETALLHTLRTAADGGHCFLPRAQLLQATRRLLENGGADALDLEAALENLATAREVVIEELDLLALPMDSSDADDSRPEDADSRQPCVYSARLHRLETGAAKHLQRLARAPVLAFPKDIEGLLQRITQRHQIELATEQIKTLHHMTQHKLLVLTGGPGTGKTTLVRTITDLFDALDKTVTLCAPTGRAAKRLSEATGRETWTLHRLLEWTPKDGGFLRNERHQLDGDLFIVDEASMVDLSLLHALLRALPDAARLLLVGDVDQLPSVGPGCVLEDIIASQRVQTVVLNQVFRQKQSSPIIDNAHHIRAGLMPSFPAAGERGEFVFVERDAPEDVQRALLTLVADRLPQTLHADPRTDIQVLVPMNRGPLGTQELNRLLQERLNPQGIAIARTGLRVGDKVMQVRNNYTLDTFNGDVGCVVSFDEEERQVVVQFDDRLVEYEMGALSELSLAYACTVHKSQGSEYPIVVFVLHSQHHIMLQRNLLYTAVTRAKKQVVLLGQRRALATGLRQLRREKRHTRLEFRLRAALPSIGDATAPRIPPAAPS